MSGSALVERHGHWLAVRNPSQSHCKLIPDNNATTVAEDMQQNHVYAIRGIPKASHAKYLMVVLDTKLNGESAAAPHIHIPSRRVHQAMTFFQAQHAVAVRGLTTVAPLHRLPGF